MRLAKTDTTIQFTFEKPDWQGDRARRFQAELKSALKWGADGWQYEDKLWTINAQHREFFDRLYEKHFGQAEVAPLDEPQRATLRRRRDGTWQPTLFDAPGL